MPNQSNTYQNPQPGTPENYPAQHQSSQPGDQQQMTPKPLADNPQYKGSGKLTGRVAVVTGGDSGIGQAVCVAFAKEGADLFIPYYNEKADAEETRRLVQALGRRCELMECDLKQEQAAFQAVEQAVKQLGSLDVLVNNIAVQFP